MRCYQFTVSLCYLNFLPWVCTCSCVCTWMWGRHVCGGHKLTLGVFVCFSILLLVCVHVCACVRVCVCACVCVHACACVCVYLVESFVSSLFYVGPGDQIKVGRMYQMSSWSSILFSILQRFLFYFYFVSLSISRACMRVRVVPSEARVSDQEVEL